MLCTFRMMHNLFNMNYAIRTFFISRRNYDHMFIICCSITLLNLRFMIQINFISDIIQIICRLWRAMWNTNPGKILTILKLTWQY